MGYDKWVRAQMGCAGLKQIIKLSLKCTLRLKYLTWSYVELQGYGVIVIR